jgi:hypothetical protein
VFAWLVTDRKRTISALPATSLKQVERIHAGIFAGTSILQPVLLSRGKLEPLTAPSFPCERTFILAAKRVLSRLLIFRLVPADYIAVRAEIMIKPFDREARSRRFVAKRFS